MTDEIDGTSITQAPDALEMVKAYNERVRANARIVQAQRSLPPFTRWVDGLTFIAAHDWDRVRARFRLPAGERPW